MISALFVETNTIYRSMGLDCWDLVRDARSYAGPNKVIAHPPCKRWGRYWSGGPSVKVRKHKGDDLGCFAVALWAVRTFGGVVEHPEASHAWAWYGLERPAKSGGWTQQDQFGGRSCCVEQGHYGHRARKATWLYQVGCGTPELIWGKAEGKEKMDGGYHSTEERHADGKGRSGKLSQAERLATPEPFARLLVGLVS